MNRLQNKVAIITGVSSGIGRAAAQLFCEQGAIVFGIDCNTIAGEALATELSGQKYLFKFYAADLSTLAECAKAAETCSSIYGRIDILYNNAGISAVLPFEQTDRVTLERMLTVNFISVFDLCQQVIPKMQRQGGGVIINTASELAIVAQPLYSAYCASKGAVLSFTRAIALEYAQANIRINALCPGPIDTPMLQQEFELDENPTQARNQGIATMPIGRLGTPEEIAKVALFLAADAPALMQGAAIVIDGAKTIL
jgi:NAD(P)-dependent dehydrogenase (short-subunit alcohol dehydrogenase family)